MHRNNETHSNKKREGLKILNMSFAFLSGKKWLTKNGLVKMGNDFYEIFAAKPLFLDTRVLKV
jgi:hypothetical protein